MKFGLFLVTYLFAEYFSEASSSSICFLFLVHKL